MNGRNIIKKIITVSAAICMCIGIGVSHTNAALPGGQGGGVETRNICINNSGTNLTRSGNTLTCSGFTYVDPGYTAKVVVELQKYYSGDWHTIKTWTAMKSLKASISETYTVTSGYSYRLKCTHSAYSGSTLIESFGSNSNTITY